MKRICMFILFPLAVLSISAFALSDAQGAIMLDKVVAIVNKEVITWSDLYKSMEFEATDAMKTLSPQERKRVFKENEHTFLETMIDMRLQLQEAEKRGLSVTKEEVTNAIDMIRGKYKMGMEDFEKAIAQEGFQMKDYRRKLADQMLLNKIVDQEVRSKIIVSEGDIDSALKDDKSLMKDIEGYVIGIITLKNSGSREEMEAKARELYNQLRAGASFAELARQRSDDPSGRSGGRLGFVSKSDLAPQLQRVLSNLNENDISEPFWTEHGISILMLQQKREIKGEKDLRDSVRQKLSEDLFNKIYKGWLKGLREKSYVEIKI